MDILSYLLGKNSAGGGGGGGGVDLSTYINLAPTTIENPTGVYWWTDSFVLSDMAKAEIVGDTTKFTYMFQNCKWTYLPKVSTKGTKSNLFLSNMFQGCEYVTSLDLSGMVGVVGRMSNIFNGCRALMHIDMRNLVLHDCSIYSACFNYVPENCEIIVKDTTEKEWLLSKFTSLTNVKTVAEYES